MGFFKTLIILLLIAGIVGLVAYDPTREAIKNYWLYSLAPALESGRLSIVQSEWWQTYQIYIVAPPVFLLGVFLTAMWYRGKIRMWQWGARKASETAYGLKGLPREPAEPEPAPPIVPTEEKEKTAT